MKDKKRQFVWFAFYDYTGIREHLERMAESGWMIEKLGNFRWQYRRIQPEKLHFSVNYFPNASDFDPIPTEGEVQMEEYCEQTGWKLAVRWGQMQIFYSEAENPVPIDTDAVTQVETIHHTMRKTMICNHLIMALLCIFQLCFQYWRFSLNPIEFLSNPVDITIIPTWAIILFAALFEICFYFYWYRKAKKKAENGIFTEIRTHRIGSFALLSVSVLIILAGFCSSSIGLKSLLFGFLLIGTVTFAINFVKKRMKKAGVSRTANLVISSAASIAMTFLIIIGFTMLVFRSDFMEERKPVEVYNIDGWNFDVYDDQLPLYVEDLVTVEPVKWSKEQRKNETFILANTEYRQWPLPQGKSIPNLYYTVTEVKMPFLYNFCKNALINLRKDEVIDGEIVIRDSYDKIDASDWGAKDAYRVFWDTGYLNKYLLCYENCIVEISFDFEPTPAQMLIVAEKLGK